MHDTRQAIALDYVARATADRSAATRALVYYTQLAREYGCSERAVRRAARGAAAAHSTV